MKTAIALSAVLATTPAMACTDWKAIAAFDAIIESGDVTMRAEMMKDANLAHSDSDRKLVAEMQDILTKHPIAASAMTAVSAPPRHEKNADTDPDGEQHRDHCTAHPTDRDNPQGIVWQWLLQRRLSRQ
jgi:hypothetical protein